jgi:predicted kinase
MQPKIYLLIGMIASGKSTYALNAANNGYIIINDDAIVNLLHANNYTLYDKNLKILYKTIENTILNMSIALKKNVVIDRGLNVSLQSRKRWLSLAKTLDIECEAIVFEKQKPEVHAKRRFESDTRGYSENYWQEVAAYHDKNYSLPSLEEGFSKINYISYEEIKNKLVF